MGRGATAPNFYQHRGGIEMGHLKIEPSEVSEKSHTDVARWGGKKVMVLAWGGGTERGVSECRSNVPLY